MNPAPVAVRVFILLNFVSTVFGCAATSGGVTPSVTTAAPATTAAVTTAVTTAAVTTTAATTTAAATTTTEATTTATTTNPCPCPTITIDDLNGAMSAQSGCLTITCTAPAGQNPNIQIDDDNVLGTTDATLTCDDGTWMYRGAAMTATTLQCIST